MKNPNLICLKCKNFDSIEGCKVFEDIPKEILDGSNDHKKPLKGQGNDVIFEPLEYAEEK